MAVKRWPTMSLRPEGPGRAHGLGVRHVASKFGFKAGKASRDGGPSPSLDGCALVLRAHSPFSRP